MKTVLITRDITPQNVQRLAGQFPQVRFVCQEEPTDEAAAGAEVIFGGLDESLLERAKCLEWFHSMSAGVDPYVGMMESARGRGVLFSNSAGVYGVPISEHVLAMMLALAHRVNLAVLNMPEAKWGGVPHCRELTGATVGIVGFGDIGRHLAMLLAPFHCEVLAFKRTPADRPAGVDEMLYSDDGLDDIMRRSDYVCVCLPGTEATRGMIDARRIGMMKPTAALLNIGRGYIVDTDALAVALAQGRLAGAGLDVTEPEPLPPEHPLWRQPNAIITPHISGYTSPQWEDRQTEFFACNLAAWLNGEPVPGAVDRVHKY